MYLCQVFLCLFILELMLKLIALGPSEFFQSSFNIFDFFVIIGSVIDVIARGVGRRGRQGASGGVRGRQAYPYSLLLRKLQDNPEFLSLTSY